MATNSKDSGSSQAASERDKAIELALGAIEKQFGKGSIMRLDKQQAVAEVKVVPTGSLGLDIALGIGGLPRGRIIEVYGPESSGKTTLTLHAVAEAQKTGGVAAFIDAEHALDVGYARKLGVKTDELLVSQPDCGEQALEIADMLVRSNAIDIIVIDSVAALTPRAELEGEMGDAHVGLQARLMSQALRKLTAAISRSNCIVVFINQIRMKIGVMFGSPETTTGGNALKFYSSVRLDIRRIGAIKNGESVVGNRTRVKVVKNKLAAPFREVEFDIVYGEGVSREGELIDLATAANIVEKSGAWLSYEGERIGQGRENAKTFLREHADVYAAIETRVLAQHDLRRPGQAEGKPDKSEGKADKSEGKAEARPSAAAKADARGDSKDDAPNGSGAAAKSAARRPTATA
jgi:recombination protein RecA